MPVSPLACSPLLERRGVRMVGVKICTTRPGPLNTKRKRSEIRMNTAERREVLRLLDEAGLEDGEGMDAAAPLQELVVLAIEEGLLEVAPKRRR